MGNYGVLILYFQRIRNTFVNILYLWANWYGLIEFKNVGGNTILIVGGDKPKAKI